MPSTMIPKHLLARGPPQTGGAGFVQPCQAQEFKYESLDFCRPSKRGQWQNVLRLLSAVQQKLFPAQDFWGTACASAGECLNIKEGSRHEKNPSGSSCSLPFWFCGLGRATVRAKSGCLEHKGSSGSRNG